MPRAPWAWAATLRPSAWAVVTIARISSSVKCASRPRPCCESTPPVAVNLITCAPARDSCADPFGAFDGAGAGVVRATSASITSGRKPLTSPWPPMIEMAGPEAMMRGPGNEILGGAAGEGEADLRGGAEVANGREARSRRDPGVLDPDHGRIFVACRPPRARTARSDRPKGGRACRSGRARPCARKDRSAARRRAAGSGRRSRSGCARRRW